MEHTVFIKIGAILKWLFPAAVGSLIAVLIGPQTTPVKGFGMFFAGIITSSYFGSGIIEYWDIQPGAVAACIYLGLGLWGMGIIIQCYKQIPELITGLREKWTK